MYLTKEQIALCVQTILEQPLDTNRDKAQAILDAVGEYTSFYSGCSVDNFFYNANVDKSFGTERFPFFWRSPFEIMTENDKGFTLKHNCLIMVWAGAFGLAKDESQFKFGASSKPGWLKVLN